MPYRVTFALDANKDKQERLEDFGALLGCLTRIDEVYLASRPNVPLLSQSGVRYLQAPGLAGASGEGDDWRDIPTCLKMGSGDDPDFAAWAAAEQRIRFGELADPSAPPRLDPSGRVTFALDAFNGRQDSRESIEDLGALLDCLVQIDEAYLLKHRNVPLLYQSGVRYREEPLGQEDWQDIPVCLQMGVADCEDLSCWLIAEKRVRFGIAARPYIIPQLRPNGRYLYHVAVALPGAPGRPPTIEDPSRILGMP